MGTRWQYALCYSYNLCIIYYLMIIHQKQAPAVYLLPRETFSPRVVFVGHADIVGVCRYAPTLLCPSSSNYTQLVAIGCDVSLLFLYLISRMDLSQFGRMIVNNLQQLLRMVRRVLLQILLGHGIVIIFSLQLVKVLLLQSLKQLNQKVLLSHKNK